MTSYECLDVGREDGVVRVWLDRPDVRNAFNPVLIEELRVAMESVGSDDAVRAVVLGGRGKVFCAGADLGWMRDMAGYTRDENEADARRLAEMLEALDSCPVPVVGRVQRAAYGGAVGLLACCDSVVCTDDCTFALSEVRLGISPATIAPYVIAKIGGTGARDLFLSGEPFDAARALRLGLVHQVVPATELDDAVDRKLARLRKAGPQAARETKALVRSMTALADEARREQTAALIARLRVSSEGQEGLGAFLEKRQPGWAPPES